MKLFCASCGYYRTVCARELCRSCYNKFWSAGGLAVFHTVSNIADYDDKFLRRCHKKTVISEVTGCWEWQGGLTGGGYAVTSYKGRQVGLHRQSYIIHHGPLNDGAQARHTCDNRRCWNPDHLVAGTALDNAQDAIERDRLSRGTRRYNAKITDEIALLIKAQAAAGVSHSAIAKEYGYSRPNVTRLVNGHIWKHLL